MKFVESLSNLSANLYEKTVKIPEATKKLAEKINDTVVEPISSFTTTEVEKAKHWPSVISEKASNLKNALVEPTNAGKNIQEIALKSKSAVVDKIVTTAEVALKSNHEDYSDVAEQAKDEPIILLNEENPKQTEGSTVSADAAVENIDFISAEESKGNNHAEIFLGDDEDEIDTVKVNSPQYRELLDDYYRISQHDGDFTLVMHGKSYGLGARGTKLDNGGTQYSAGDIEKLYHKSRKSSS